ncbi:MAG TPA: zinc ribbon domain-containing protein [Chthoniobacterales bacterium]
MPIYEYEIVDGPCTLCGGRFELRRPASRPDLKKCPVCRKEVRKVVSSASTPRVTKPLSVSDAKSAGFTVLKRRDSGTYERM